jgi:hypothetical protein
MTSFGQGDKPATFGADDKSFEPKKNFWERWTDDIDNRSKIAGDIIDRQKDGEQGLVSSVVQMVGKVGAAGIMDFMGEVLVSGGRGLSAITPDVIEDPIKDTTVAAAVAFMNTDIGKAGGEAAANGMEAYQAWAKAHPVASANFEAVVDVALLVAPVKGKPKGSILANTATKAEQSAVRKSVRTKERFVKELVTPVRNKKTKIDQVARTTEVGMARDKWAHPFRRVKIKPTPAEAASAAELMKIHLRPKRSIQKNYELMATAVNKETKALMSRLKRTGAAGRFDKDALLKELDDALTVLITQEEAIVGSAKSSATRAVARMKREVEASGNHVSDLLKARKKFDAHFRTQGKEALLDPVSHNAMTMAIRQVRRTTNDFINAKVPSAGVKRSLQKQSNILRAMDDVKVKAAIEPDLALARLGSRILKVLTLRGELNQSFALVFGVGGLGAAAMFAPWILKGGITAGIFYGGGKAVMAPSTRKGLAKLLRLTDKATLGITDPAVLRQMRMDRALIVELLESAQIEDNPRNEDK